MNNNSILEENYKKYIKNIRQWIPEGIINVDLNLLHKLNVINYYNKESYDPALTRYFHVVESEEKITLVNEEFVVWIVPEKINNVSITYTLIALNKDNEIHLETAFATSGVYNTSRLVLRLLEKFLFDIQETEEVLTKLGKSS
jgi:hypothetical protein